MQGRFDNRPRMSSSERSLAALALVGTVVVFGLARWLEPDPRGFGTHQQLGLPECTFRRLTGVTCPHCGMTTSFSWFVRGEFHNALRTNAAGLIAAVLSAAASQWLLLSVIAGRWVWIAVSGRCVLMTFAAWTAFAVVLWIWRML